MRRSLLLAAPLLLCAVPASATQGFACRTMAPPGVTIMVVIGTGIGTGVVGVTLHDGERTLSTFDGGDAVLGQSWVDERALLIELVPPDRDGRIARLRVGLGGELESSELTGWLEYAGRRWRTVCAPD
jgi:hypothetical protein